MVWNCDSVVVGCFRFGFGFVVDKEAKVVIPREGWRFCESSYEGWLRRLGNGRYDYDVGCQGRMGAGLYYAVEDFMSVEGVFVGYPGVERKFIKKQKISFVMGKGGKQGEGYRKF